MRAIHGVERLDVEFAFSSEAQAWALHARLADFASARASEIIGEVFDEFSDETEVFRIDSLEIDLGAVEADEIEFENRLRAAVRREIGDLLRGARPDGRATAVEPVARPQADFELLWGLLRLGRLPWRAGLLDARAIDALIGRVLSTRGPELVTSLRAAPHAAALAARIARQWSLEHRLRLWRLLAPESAPPAPGEDGAADSVATSWEEALIGALRGGEAPPDEPEAFEAELARAWLGPSVRRGLEGGDRARVVAALRRRAADAAWRQRLAASLTPSTRRWLVAAWAPGAEADLVVALAEAGPRGAALDRRARLPLDEALLTVLPPQVGRTPDLGAVLPMLAGARARAEGWAPDVAAARLLDSFPLALAARFGPAVRAAFGLDPQAADGPETEEGAKEDAGGDSGRPRLDEHRRELVAAFAERTTADEAWRRLFAAEPAWLAAQLRRWGVEAAWRRAIAPRLSRARWSELISLWLPPEQAPVLSAMIQAGDLWMSGLQGAAPGLIQEWLLGALLLSEASRLEITDVILELLQQSARCEDLEPTARAWRLVRARPSGAAHRAARRALFRAATRLEGEPELQAEMSARAQASAKRAADVRSADLPSETQRRSLLDELAPRSAKPATKLVEALSAAWSRAGLPPSDLRALNWRVLADDLLGAESGDFAVGAFVSRWIDAAADAASIDRREADARLGSALEAIARETSREGGDVDLPPGAFSSAWLDALPDPLPPAQWRRVAAALTPAEAGMRRLSGLAEAQRRELVVRVAGEHGRRALATLDRLARVWRGMGLAAPANASFINWSLVLDALFGAAAPFDADAFAARWLDRAAEAMQPGGRPDARAALRAALRSEAVSTVRAAASDVGGGEASLQIPDGPFSPVWLQALPDPLPRPLHGLLVDAMRPAEAGLRRLEALTEAQRRELVVRLAGGEGRRVLEACERLEQAHRRAGLPPPAASSVAWSLILDAVFGASGSFDVDDLTAAWIDAAPRLHGRVDAGAGAVRTTAVPSALKAVLGGDAAAAPEASSSDHDREGGAELPDGRPSAAGLESLPNLPPRLRAPPTKASPAANGGLERVEPLTEAQPRDLVARLAGEEARSALASVDRLDQTSPRAGLRSPLNAAGAPAPAPGDPVVDGGGVLPEGPFTPEWFEALPPALPPAMRRALTEALAPASAGLRRISRLGEAGRRALIMRSLPHDGAPALAAHDRLSRAWEAAALPQPAGDAVEIAWRFLLVELFEQGRRFDAGGFAGRWFAARLTESSVERPDTARVALAEALQAGATAGAPLDLALALLAGRRPEAAQGAPTPGAAAAPAPDFGLQAGESLYVANAGLVLIGPYVSTLFQRLGLVADQGFVDAAAAERGVHLLQLVADGGRPALEPQLVLNKLLCDLDLTTPLSRDFSATEMETALVESLLQAIIASWNVLGSTSIAGLRETFLQREGALTWDGQAWRLKVAPGPFDMLIDRLPWGFRMLKLPWMTQVIHVDWR